MSDIKEIKEIKDDLELEAEDSVVLSELKSIQAGKEINLIDIAGKRNFYVIVSLFVFNIIISTHQIIVNESDDVAIAYSLPDQRNMDAPVLLKEVDQGTLRDVDLLMKGFIRQYMSARYPKNSLEARMKYEFIERHSLGNVKNDFTARLSRIEEIKSKIDSGFTVNIYPKSSDDLKIRKNGFLGNWIAEFDGRYVADMGTDNSARAYVKVRMEISRGDRSIKNSPSGFYVSDYKVTYVKDGITNEMKDL